MQLCIVCNIKPAVKKYCSKQCSEVVFKIKRENYILRNKEKIKITQHKYKQKNKEKILEYNNEWCKTHKNYIKEYNKKYRAANEETIKSNYKKYYEKNKELIKANARNYRLKRSPEQILKIRKKAKNEYHTNFKEKIRRFITNSFKRIATNKSVSTEKILGCSFDKAKKHIESLFQEGMSWENYGQWHIDHIKPLASVKNDNIDEIMAVNNIQNLQPLWSTDNISKGAKYHNKDYRNV